jgi:hypothetical protein
VSRGTWSPTPTSFGFQWQRCSSSGTDCVNVAGATRRTACARSTSITGCVRS